MFTSAFVCPQHAMIKTIKSLCITAVLSRLWTLSPWQAKLNICYLPLNNSLM